MHPRLRARLLRLQNVQPEVSHPQLALGDVEGTSLPPVPLGERLAEAIACCDPDPAEAERLRLQFLKERG
jgi:hypothetical protein